MGDFKFSFADFEVNAPSMFRELWREKDFTNVTLVANDDRQFTAHKIILSASSPLLRRIMTNNPHQNPLIYLSNISSAELELVIKFVYLGTCQVPQAGLVPFLAAGKALEVRGLADDLSPKSDERPVDKSENNLKADIDADSPVTSPSETEEKEAEDPIHVNTEIKKETLREHLYEPGWQKLCGGTGGPRRKVWTRTKILSPNIRYFIRICRDLCTFWRSLGKKVSFWVKNSVSWARSALLHGIYCIFH